MSSNHFGKFLKFWCVTGDLGETTRLFRFMKGVSSDMLMFLYQKADLFVLPPKAVKLARHNV